MTLRERIERSPAIRRHERRLLVGWIARERIELPTGRLQAWAEEILTAAGIDVDVVVDGELNAEDLPAIFGIDLELPP